LIYVTGTGYQQYVTGTGWVAFAPGAGSYLAKASNLSDLANVTTAKTNLSLVKADVGLGSVDNTADTAKPVSTATTTQLNLKLPLAGGSMTGDISFTTTGKGIKLKDLASSNARSGLSVLVAGTVVVANTSVTANTRVQLTSQVDGGTPGWLRVSARTSGTSFTILSSSATDTSSVAWLLVEAT
jgi:hypothetical protein